MLFIRFKLEELASIIIILFVPRSAERCALNTSIQTFPENVPIGTVVLEFTLDDEEEWIFDEAEPLGYLDFEVHGFSVKILLSKIPDIEEINRQYAQYTDSLRYTLECSTGSKTHIYEQIVKILDVNEYSPHFKNTSVLQFAVNESTPVNTRVFDLFEIADDEDVNGRVTEFSIEPHVNVQQDGKVYFEMSVDRMGIILRRQVDYEDVAHRSNSLHLNISAKDNGYPAVQIAYANITVVILDEDDQDPEFVHPNCVITEENCIISKYSAEVAEHYTPQIGMFGTGENLCAKAASVVTGLLQLHPAQLKAVDMDTMNFPVRYTLIEVTPEEYKVYFSVDNLTGDITLLYPLGSSDGNLVLLTLKAEEVSDQSRSKTTSVTVQHKSANFYNSPSSSDEAVSIQDKTRDSGGHRITYPHSDAVYLKNWLPYVHIMLVIISLMCLLWCTLMIVVFKIIRKNRNALKANVTMNGYRHNEQQQNTSNIVVEEGITAFRADTPEHLDISPYTRLNKPRDILNSRLSPLPKHSDLFSCASSSTSSSRGLVCDSPLTPRNFRKGLNLSDSSSFTLPPSLPLSCNKRLPMLKYGPSKSENRMKISFDSKGDTYI